MMLAPKRFDDVQPVDGGLGRQLEPKKEWPLLSIVLSIVIGARYHVLFIKVGYLLLVLFIIFEQSFHFFTSFRADSQNFNLVDQIYPRS